MLFCAFRRGPKSQHSFDTRLDKIWLNCFHLFIFLFQQNTLFTIYVVSHESDRWFQKIKANTVCINMCYSIVCIHSYAWCKSLLHSAETHWLRAELIDRLIYYSARDGFGCVFRIAATYKVFDCVSWVAEKHQITHTT